MNSCIIMAAILLSSLSPRGETPTNLTALISNRDQIELPDGVDGRPAILESDASLALVAASQAERQFNDGDEVVFLYRGEDYLQSADGRCSRRSHTLMLVRADSIPVALRQVNLPFNPLTQRVVVHKYLVHEPDGSVRDLTDRIVFHQGQVARMQSDSGAKSEQLLGKSVCLISHPEIAPGSVVELDLETGDTTAWRPWLEGTVNWRGEFRSLLQIVAVTCPSQLQLNHRVRNRQLSPQQFQNDSSITHLWRASDLKPISSLELKGRSQCDRESLIFSTCPSWDDLATHIRDDLYGAVVADSLISARVNREILGGPARSRIERVEAILDLSREIYPVRPDQSLAWDLPEVRGSASLSPAQFGSWVQTAHLMALLKEAGFWNQLVMRSADHLPELTVPGLGRFDRLLINAYAWPDSLLIDPNKRRILNRSLNWSYRPLWLVSPRQSKWQFYTAENGTADVEIAIDLGSSGEITSGTAEVFLSGGLYPYESLQDPVVFFESYLRGLVPDAKLGTYRISTVNDAHCRVQFTFTALEAGIAVNQRRNLHLSGGPTSIDELLAPQHLNLPKRMTTLTLPETFHERITWRITTPAELSPQFLPSPAAFRNQVGEFRLNSSRIDLEDGSAPGSLIEVSWFLGVSMAEIPPEHYKDLQDLLDLYEAESQRLIVFESRSK